MERREPRLALPRIGLAVALGAGAVGVLAVAGLWAAGFVRGYVHGRAVHAHEFGEIRLVPEPPPWIKPGRAGLLAGILERSGHPRDGSALDRDLGQIAKDFPMLSPWIKRVRRVERSYPNRVTVRLAPGDYREPVARVILEGRDPKDRVGIPVDGEGVVLPEDEIHWPAAGPVLWIKGKGMPPPEAAAAVLGRELKFTAADGEPRPDRHVGAAIRLAGFLKGRMQDEGAGPGAGPIRVAAIFLDERKALWIATGDVHILWDVPAGPHPGDADPTAARWDRLRAWFAGRPAPGLGPGEFLDASGDRVRVRTARSSGGSPRGASH